MLTVVRTTIAASAEASLLKDSLVELLTQDVQVEIALATTAVGVTARVSSGSDILQDDGPVFVLAAGVAPRYPDDFLLSDVAAAGDRLQVKAKNTTAGALDVICAVKLTPI